MPATLLLSGQVLYIAVTLLHADGDANNHPAVFLAYAASSSWIAVHLGQFLAMAILIAGLLMLAPALEAALGRPHAAIQFGTGSAVAALALYGALQAVDGIALKHAVDAWAAAPEAEKATRFASAEAIRWLEWGTRSYHDIALGLSLLLFAVATAKVSMVFRPIAYLMGIAGLAYLSQGWVVGAEGFSSTGTITIVTAFALDLIWMTWLSAVAWRTQAPAASLRK
jgi:hypothetical protein